MPPRNIKEIVHPEVKATLIAVGGKALPTARSEIDSLTIKYLDALLDTLNLWLSIHASMRSTGGWIGQVRGAFSYNLEVKCALDHIPPIEFRQYYRPVFRTQIDSFKSLLGNGQSSIEDLLEQLPPEKRGLRELPQGIQVGVARRRFLSQWYDDYEKTFSIMRDRLGVVKVVTINKTPDQKVYAPAREEEVREMVWQECERRGVSRHLYEHFVKPCVQALMNGSSKFQIVARAQPEVFNAVLNSQS